MKFEPSQEKTSKLTCASREDSDQPGHPLSLIRVLAVRMKKAWVLSYPLSVQRWLWSDWIDAQADLSFRWAGMLFRWVCHGAAHLFFLSLLCCKAYLFQIYLLEASYLVHKEINHIIYSQNRLLEVVLWYFHFCCALNTSLITRNPVFGVCNQARLKPVCSATEGS